MLNTKNQTGSNQSQEAPKKTESDQRTNPQKQQPADQSQQAPKQSESDQGTNPQKKQPDSQNQGESGSNHTQPNKVQQQDPKNK